VNSDKRRQHTRKTAKTYDLKEWCRRNDLYFEQQDEKLTERLKIGRQHMTNKNKQKRSDKTLDINRKTNDEDDDDKHDEKLA